MLYFHWGPGRGTEVLEDLFAQVHGKDHSHRGTIQCAGYRVYDTSAARHPGITFAGCWAHTRRKFHEALQGGQPGAAPLLRTIQSLYSVERDLRQIRAGPEQPLITRQREAQTLVQDFFAHGLALRQSSKTLPKSPLGQALDYALSQQTKLDVFLRDGRVEIDSNGAESAIRPTAVGTKRPVGCCVGKVEEEGGASCFRLLRAH